VVTSRFLPCMQGYLAAVSASAYSFISMLQHFGPLMNPGAATISLTYLASEQIVPGARMSLCTVHPTLQARGKPKRLQPPVRAMRDAQPSGQLTSVCKGRLHRRLESCTKSAKLSRSTELA